MKKSGLLAASLAAASATAVSASSPSSMQISHQDMAQRDHENCSSVRSSAPEKFAPRFDGLKFIETLITAHR